MIIQPGDMNQSWYDSTDVSFTVYSVARLPIVTYTRSLKVTSLAPQGLVAIFLLFIIFHIIYDYTIKGAIDEKIKF